ncbi:unnamed protein product [Allacma fusca]|uniref:Uncharacterized protein n=1 Tax=Allacma fusca TaxID=39272 RepID=A0A8J2LBC6_9HEXA|nr:unnamed protein product [Allacma fusca]
MISWGDKLQWRDVECAEEKGRPNSFPSGCTAPKTYYGVSFNVEACDGRYARNPPYASFPMLSISLRLGDQEGMMSTGDTGNDLSISGSRALFNWKEDRDKDQSLLDNCHNTFCKGESLLLPYASIPSELGIKTGQ